MIRGVTFLLMAGLAYGGDSDAVLRAWIRNPSSNAAVSAILPEVHSIETGPSQVIVRSAGLSLTSFGALQVNAYEAPSGVRSYEFRLPRTPQPAKTRIPVAQGIVGVFVNGVPLWNTVSTASYRDQNLWHSDAIAVAAKYPGGDSPLLTRLLAAYDRHSPLIGFAMDGYPIYGPYGFDQSGKIQRMRSSYRLRSIQQRTVWPDGTVLTPGQVGPDVSPEYPLGAFVEDYEYVPGAGDLDESNARFAITPEYPQGTYAYFLATDPSGGLAFPYLIGPVYRGVVAVTQPSRDRPKAGVPYPLYLDIRRPYLEKVHEKTVHLLVVSDDLSEFAHIHPTPAAGGGYTVNHTFQSGGRYHLYADSVLPGEAPSVRHSGIQVEGNPRTPQPLHVDLSPKTLGGITVSLTLGTPVRTGADIPVGIALADAGNGQSFTDLQPFLGAWAHFVVVSEDHQEFIHGHPLEDGATATVSESDPHLHITPTGPSPARIHTSLGFRHPGKYKLWAQVQRAGEVLTFPFVLEVAQGSERVIQATPAGFTRVDVTPSGFSPARVEAVAGRRVRLAFVRHDAQNCGGVVKFPELALERQLPPGQLTLVEFDAPRSGTLSFSCGMGMMRGAVVLRNAE